MTDQAIKIKDLTPGTVVEPKPVTVSTIQDGRAYVTSNEGMSFWLLPADIESIIFRPKPPETDAEKIARLEAELAERDARIAELTKRASDVIDGTTSPAPQVLDPAVVSRFCAGIEPTPVQWSDPIEGPPPKGLPAGSYEVRFSEEGGWIKAVVPSAYFSKEKAWVRHRIAMNKRITWEGGECPVPGDWWVVTSFNSTETGCGGPAASYYWGQNGGITSFTLTSCGGK